MRIAVNARFLLPGKLEGLGWYTHELLQRMVLRHPEVEFIFLFDREYDPAFVYAANVIPVVLRPKARHPLSWYAWFEWSVPRALRRYGADLFFSPDSYLSLCTRIPTVMTVHDLIPLEHPNQVRWWSRDYYRRFLPRYMRQAGHLVAVSAFTKESIARLGCVGPEKISVVYNGSRTGFKPLAAPEKQQIRDRYAGGQPYFFYTGAIHPRKNIPRLIRAFDAFKSRTQAPAKLLLAGRFAWETGAVTAAFEAAKHKADIKFLNYLPENELVQVMASALALVYISLYEGFGLPVLEAFHCDTAVICSNSTALPEVAGDAALLVDPLSETETANAMEQLYTDSDFRNRLIEKGRIQRRKFDWDQAANQIFELLISDLTR